MEIMDNIKKLRKERGYSQADMAEILQTTQQQYSKYENGTHEIPVRHLITICKHFNVSADEILGIKAEESPSKDVIEAAYREAIKMVDTAELFRMIRDDKKIQPNNINEKKQIG